MLTEGYSIKRKNSKFIVFEGGHGSGKTTQAEKLVDFLHAKQIKACYTKEPYGTDFIPLIEKFAKKIDINSPVLMYLIAASRYCHVQDINKLLKTNNFVICDRYIISSLVYQQIQGFSTYTISKVNSFIIKPDVTFYMRASLSKRLMRLRCIERKRETTIFSRKKHLQKSRLCMKIS